MRPRQQSPPPSGSMDLEQQLERAETEKRRQFVVRRRVFGVILGAVGLLVILGLVRAGEGVHELMDVSAVHNKYLTEVKRLRVARKCVASSTVVYRFTKAVAARREQLEESWARARETLRAAGGEAILRHIPAKIEWRPTWKTFPEMVMSTAVAANVERPDGDNRGTFVGPAVGAPDAVFGLAAAAVRDVSVVLSERPLATHRWSEHAGMDAAAVVEWMRSALRPCRPLTRLFEVYGDKVVDADSYQAPKPAPGPFATVDGSNALAWMTTQLEGWAIAGEVLVLHLTTWEEVWGVRDMLFALLAEAHHRVLRHVIVRATVPDEQAGFPPSFPRIELTYPESRTVLRGSAEPVVFKSPFNVELTPWVRTCIDKAVAAWETAATADAFEYSYKLGIGRDWVHPYARPVDALLRCGVGEAVETRLAKSHWTTSAAKAKKRMSQYEDGEGIVYLVR